MSINDIVETVTYNLNKILNGNKIPDEIIKILTNPQNDTNIRDLLSHIIDKAGKTNLFNQHMDLSHFIPSQHNTTNDLVRYLIELCKHVNIKNKFFFIIVLNYYNKKLLKHTSKKTNKKNTRKNNRKNNKKNYPLNIFPIQNTIDSYDINNDQNIINQYSVDNIQMIIDRYTDDDIQMIIDRYTDYDIQNIINDYTNNEKIVESLKNLRDNPPNIKYVGKIRGDGYCYVRSVFYMTLIRYPEHLYNLFDKFVIDENTFNMYNEELAYNGKYLYTNYENFIEKRELILQLIDRLTHLINYDYLIKNDKYIMEFIKFMFTIKLLDDVKRKNYWGQLMEFYIMEDAIEEFNAIPHGLSKEERKKHYIEIFERLLIENMRNLGNLHEYYFQHSLNCVLGYYFQVKVNVHIATQAIGSNFCNEQVYIDNNIYDAKLDNIIDLLSIRGNHYEILLTQKDVDKFVNNPSTIKNNKSSTLTKSTNKPSTTKPSNTTLFTTKPSTTKSTTKISKISNNKKLLGDRIFKILGQFGVGNQQIPDNIKYIKTDNEKMRELLKSIVLKLELVDNYNFNASTEKLLEMLTEKSDEKSKDKKEKNELRVLNALIEFQTSLEKKNNNNKIKNNNINTTNYVFVKRENAVPPPKKK